MVDAAGGFAAETALKPLIAALLARLGIVVRPLVALETGSTAIGVTETYAARLRPRGQITIPRAVRDALALQQGDTLSVARVGDAIIMTPRHLKTPALAAAFSAIMEEEGITLAELLTDLAEERERIWRERQDDPA